MKIRNLFIYLALTLCLPGAFAQSSATGTVRGKITDARTGDPLPGANIILVHTLMGASCGLDGSFVVSHVPAGSYQVKATMMGYKSHTSTIQVTAGEEIQVDFSLQETVIENPAVIVTASKKAQSFQDVPNSVSLISLKEIERRNKTYLDQLLEYTPGVHLMQGDINIRGSSGFSLGAGSRVLLLIDGIPMMPGDSGDIKWDIIPLSQIDRVEIIKGAGSALYGSHALGGVINIITKEPGLKPTTSIQLTTGLYDKPYYPEWEWTDNTLYFTQLDATYTRSWTKSGLFISAGRKQSTGYQQNGDYESYNFVGKLNYKFNPHSTFTVQSNFTGGDYGEIFLWRNQNDVFEMPVPAVGDWNNSNKFSWNMVFRQLVNSRLTYKIRTSYFYNNFKHHHHDNSDYSAANKVGMEIQGDYIPNKIHTLTFGFEGIFDNTTSAVWGNHDGYILAAYVQDELNLAEKVTLTLGSRFDCHTVDTGENDNQFNPKLGLNFKPTLLTTVRASVGRGFRAPTVAEMFTETFTAGFKVIRNPYLKAESAWSYEIGVNQVINQHFIFDLALFHNDYNNFIEPEPDIYQTVQFTNVANARIRGIELTGQASLFRQLLSLNIGYTFMQPEDLDTGEDLAYRPRHLFTAGGTVRFLIFEAGLDYRYISRLERVKVYPNDDRVDQKIWDARLSTALYDFGLAFNVNNALQYNYLQIERNLSPVRNYVFTISRQF